VTEDLVARVVTVSTRAAAGAWEDTSGPILVAGLQDLGFACEPPIVVPDGDDVARVLREAVADDVHVVLTTGGTGHTPADLTPEQTLMVIERESPGLAEAVRSYGVAHGVPTAILSRGIAGIAGRTLIVNLPGSSGGARDGIAALSPVLRHAVDQIRGGDHTRTADTPKA
jgi:molybdenum cofactor synthesis domain-containing protein